jgi:hypothetical protein
MLPHFPFVHKILKLSTIGHSFHLTPTLCHQQGKMRTESIYEASPSRCGA